MLKNDLFFDELMSQDDTELISASGMLGFDENLKVSKANFWPLFKEIFDCIIKLKILNDNVF